MDGITLAQIDGSIRPRMRHYVAESKIDASSLLFHIRRPNLWSRRIPRPFQSHVREIFEIVIESSESSTTRMSFFVKIHENMSEAVEEYRNLQLLWNSFRHSPTFKIPKPIDLISDLNALVTGPVTGRNLGEELRWFRIFPLRKDRISALLADTRQAVRWLTYLHDIETEPFANRMATKSLESRLEELLATARSLGFPKDLASKVAVIFDDLQKAAGMSKLAIVHSNFAPQHVFIDRNVTSVLDFEHLRIGPRAIDFAWFIVSVDTMLLLPNSRPYAGLVKSEFLQSAGDGIESWREQVIGFYISIMIEKWVNMMQSLAGGCTPVRYALLSYSARRALKNIQSSCVKGFPESAYISPK